MWVVLDMLDMHPHCSYDYGEDGSDSDASMWLPDQVYCDFLPCQARLKVKREVVVANVSVKDIGVGGVVCGICPQGGGWVGRVRCVWSSDWGVHARYP